MWSHEAFHSFSNFFGITIAETMIITFWIAWMMRTKFVICAMDMPVMIGNIPKTQMQR